MSSISYTGDLGGLSGADAKCQDRANAAGLGGVWKAWLSTSSVDAKNRIADHAYYLVNNSTQVCSSKADLLDSSLMHAISMSETGTELDIKAVWTGTQANGTKGPDRCVDWTSTTGGNGTAQLGYSTYSDATWTYAAWTYCTNSLNLYCFED